MGLESMGYAEADLQPEAAYTDIYGWLDQKIAAIEDSETTDYYVDIQAVYELARPTDGLQNEPFQKLNEHLVMHGIRIADAEIIELALPHIRPCMQFELYADIINASRSNDALASSLLNGSLQRIEHVLNSVDLQTFKDTGYSIKYAETVLQSVKAWFRTHVVNSGSANPSETNSSLESDLQLMFDRVEINIKKIAIQNTAGDIVPHNIISLISNARNYLARLCVINGIESKFIADEYGVKPYINLPNLIVRARLDILTEREAEYMRDQIRYDPRAEDPNGLASFVALAIAGDETMERRLIENLQESRTSYGTSHFIVGTIRWAAPDLYLKMLPYLTHIVESPADIDDLLGIRFATIGQTIKQSFESGMRDFNDTEKKSSQTIEDRFVRTFWYGLYLAGSGQLRELSRSEGNEARYTQEKDRMLDKIHAMAAGKIDDTVNPKTAADEMVLSLLKGYSDVDGEVLINGLLDMVDAMARYSLSELQIVKEIVAAIHPVYRTLLSRRSRFIAASDIEARVEKIQSKYSDPLDTSRLNRLGLDQLSNLFVTTLKRKIGEADTVEISDNFL